MRRGLSKSRPRSLKTVVRGGSSLKNSELEEKELYSHYCTEKHTTLNKKFRVAWRFSKRQANCSILDNVSEKKGSKKT